MENTTPYGEVWRTQPADFWDWMWKTRQGTEITERILTMCMEADSIVEIGCGYGHFCKELLGRGWKGAKYLGFDISDGPLTMHDFDPRVTAIRGDFMTALAREGPRVLQADLVVSQAVLCHQAHWLPMTLAALRCSDRVAMDISYVTNGPLHVPRLREDSCYDTYTSEPQLRAEIATLALPIHVERMYDPKRKRDELLLTTEAP